MYYFTVLTPPLAPPAPPRDASLCFAFIAAAICPEEF